MFLAQWTFFRYVVRVVCCVVWQQCRGMNVEEIVRVFCVNEARPINIFTDKIEYETDLNGNKRGRKHFKKKKNYNNN